MLKPRFANKSFARLTIPGIAVTGLIGGYFYYRTPAANPSTGGQAERTRQKRDKEAMGGAGIGGNAMSGGHETGQPGSGIQPGTGDVERSVKTTASKEELPAGGVGGGHGGGNSNTRAIDMTAKKETRNDLTDSMGVSGSSSDSSLGSGNSNKKAAKADSGDSSNDTSTTTDAPSTASSSKPPTRPGDRSNNEALGSESTDYKVQSQSYPTSKKDHKPNTKTESTQGLGISQRLQSTFGQGGKSSSEPGEVKKMYDNTMVQSNHADTPTKRHKMRSDS